ncbi:type II RES/Xre toxin-antitoxin system antitoxin [Bradyrhizobium arachidis]|nr:antitoxin Xre/MbcA/ParS toxin-binding domain-containing protein [Bradyrhizobium arachidis]SFU87159.1 putative toxin-antitoxin system antitoxin component, TIGR02293 family [Bradyrhizobium arachidis]
MKHREADIGKASKRKDKSRASVPHEGILRIIETKYTPNRKVTWGLHGKTHVKVIGGAVETVKGYFDLVTGLSTVTETPGFEGHSARPDAAAPELFDVLVVDRHTFQVAPTALRCLYNYSDEEIQRFVVPKRTLARRFEKNEVLTVEETDKAVRLARVDKLAAKVFGDAEKAHRWLRKPKSSLGGETPLAYLSTEAGARAVEDMLHQIDHGILP